MFFSAKWRSMVATDSLFSRTRRFKRSSFATSSASSRANCASASLCAVLMTVPDGSTNVIDSMVL